MVAGADVPDLSAFIGPRPAWMADAACRETPQVIFFPTAGQSTDEAKAVCARCLVAAECLAYARGNGEEAGVWGGQTMAPPRGHGTPRGPREPRASKPLSAEEQAKLDKLAARAAGWRRKALAARERRAASGRGQAARGPETSRSTGPATAGRSGSSESTTACGAA